MGFCWKMGLRSLVALRKKELEIMDGVRLEWMGTDGILYHDSMCA